MDREKVEERSKKVSASRDIKSKGMKEKLNAEVKKKIANIRVAASGLANRLIELKNEENVDKWDSVLEYLEERRSTGE